mgnify:CR=1 FL=1
MNLGQYRGVKLIGQGIYGKIFQGRSLRDNSNVVIKMISLYEKPQNYIKEIEEEIRNLKELSDESYEGAKYIVKYITDYEIMMGRTKYKIIIMEDLSEWKTLEKYMEFLIKRDLCTRIPPDILKHIIFQLIKGLEYIHSRGIAHRDIKPENIMIDFNYNIKYIDFGMSCTIDCIDEKGTPLYLPPETPIMSNDKIKLPEKLVNDDMVLHNLKIKQKHDVWSLGLVIYQLTNLRRYPDNFPFDIPNNGNVYTFLSGMRANHYKYPSEYLYEYGYSDLDFNELISQILVINPEERPTSNDLINYFN